MQPDFWSIINSSKWIRTICSIHYISYISLYKYKCPKQWWIRKHLLGPIKPEFLGNDASDVTHLTHWPIVIPYSISYPDQYCLMPPCHYLNQHRFIIHEVLWCSQRTILQQMLQISFTGSCFKIMNLRQMKVQDWYNEGHIYWLLRLVLLQ